MRALVITCMVVVCVPVARGGSVLYDNAEAAVQLVPDTAGPYTVGQELTIDVWLRSGVNFEVMLNSIRLDFTRTHPALVLYSTFSFDFSSLSPPIYYAVYPDLPAPSIVNQVGCYCGNYWLVLPRRSSLHIGSIGLTLPADVGVYRLDALNRTESNPALGARITGVRVPGLTAVTWRALNGDIAGGYYNFRVVPEPATLALVILGVLGFAWGRRGRRRAMPHSTGIRSLC